MRFRSGFVALTLSVALVASLFTVAGANALPRLETGFGDSLFATSSSQTREEWLERATEAGASIVRINVEWRSVAPRTPPAGFEPADPASPGYEWQLLDDAVRSASHDGLKVMLTVYEAPRWAEGPNRPKETEPGVWKPQASAYEAFAKALATRYDGSFPDPAFPGSALPRVRYFEAWNEPNLDTYLSPQWEGSRATGPAIYRELLNSFYTGIKSAQPGATIIAGSLAPFGDRPGGARTPPVEFLRGMLCLQGGRLYTTPCRNPAHFDALSDHPIAVGSPMQSARSPLDVTTPNLGRLTKVLRRAEATKRALPRGHKPLWVTEFWYDSDPPDPDGVPLYRQARWYEQDLYLFWKQGAHVAITLQIRDAPPGKGYEYTSQAGVYFLDGSPKPSRTAFRFPFVAERADKRSVTVWGIPPARGRLKVQERHDGSWATIRSMAVKQARGPFSLTLPIQGKGQLRAVVGGEASLPWSLG
ncbi:MAG TPA: hypothetical protein VMH33_06965 [Solirubrobacterales bacterium]|nr:hypothetical protein [Solirubrobacterales bacterium]